MKKHIVHHYCELDYARTLCGKYLETKHTGSWMLARWATCKTCLKIHKKQRKWEKDLAKAFR